MNATDQFHVGIVAADPHATMAELTAIFGYQWCDPMGGTSTVTLPDGDVELEIQLWYSRTTPRLEVIQAIPGTTVWQPTDPGAHHLGYWADDVAGSIAQLQAHGYELEAAGSTPDKVMLWAFLRPASGPRVELLSRAMRPAMEAYFAS